MPKVEVTELRLGLSAITDKAMVGILDKRNPMVWLHKQEIDNDFIHAVITRWKGQKQVFTHGGSKFEVSVRDITNEKKK